VNYRGTIGFDTLPNVFPSLFWVIMICIHHAAGGRVLVLGSVGDNFGAGAAGLGDRFPLK